MATKYNKTISLSYLRGYKVLEMLLYTLLECLAHSAMLYYIFKEFCSIPKQ